MTGGLLAIAALSVVGTCRCPASGRGSAHPTDAEEISGAAAHPGRRRPGDPCAEARRTMPVGHRLQPRPARNAGSAKRDDAGERERQLQRQREDPLLWVATVPRGNTGREITSATLWYLSQPGGACMQIQVDGRVAGYQSTRSQDPASPGSPRFGGGMARRGEGRPSSHPDGRSREPRERRPQPTSGGKLAHPGERRPPPTAGGSSPAISLHPAGHLPLASRSRGASPGSGAPRTAPSSAFRALKIDLPRGSHRIAISPVGEGVVRLFGWVLRREGPGVVVHNVGVPGAQAATAWQGDERLLKAQLERLSPTLAIVWVGTNDAYDRRLTPERFQKRLSRLLAQVRQGSPRPDCLVMGAPAFGDSNYRKARRLRRRAGLIRTIQRRVAAWAGCAYWDVYAAMGGARAVARFIRARPKFMYRDRVHLTAAGYRALGELLFDALRSRYAAYLAARPRLGVSPPRPTEPARERRERRRSWPAGLRGVPLQASTPTPLGRVFRTLVLMARGAREARVSILHVGDSHVAGDHLTGVLRARLQRTFGDGGHGYVQAGHPWTGFWRAGLTTGAEGPWRYYYLGTLRQDDQPQDRWFGLGGVSTWISLPLPEPPEREDGVDAGARRAGSEPTPEPTKR